MDAAQIIEKLGGTLAVARLFDITAPSVSEWKHPDRGIPKARMQTLRLLHPDLFGPAPSDKEAA